MIALITMYGTADGNVAPFGTLSGGPEHKTSYRLAVGVGTLIDWVPGEGLCAGWSIEHRLGELLAVTSKDGVPAFTSE